MSLLPERELQAVEAWFAELKEALGVSEGADRGRVLASVRKLVADNDGYNNEKRVVAAALAYTRWGDLYTWAKEKLVAVPEVELPEVFSEPPNGWVFRPGGDYDKAQKRLVKTRLRVKELWAYLDREVAADPTDSEWAESIKAQAVTEFVASKEAENFEKLCLAFVRNYDEEDPSTTWVEVTNYAAYHLERDPYLPGTAVNELLEYASAKGVEVLKTGVTYAEDTYSPSLTWFNYLLTNYLLDQTRATLDEVLETTDLVYEAVKLWGCTETGPGNNPNRPTMKQAVWEQSVNLSQLKAAYNKVVSLKKDGKQLSRNDWEDAVRTAVKATSKSVQLEPNKN